MTSHETRALRPGLEAGILTALLFSAFLALLILAPQGARAAEGAVIKEFVMAKSIVEREPADITEHFSDLDSRAYAFVRVDNQGEPTTLSFIWYHEESIHAELKMRIGTSSAWRTWSSVRLKPGNWRVQLLRGDGELLDQRTFRVGNMNNGAISQMPAEHSPAGGDTMTEDTTEEATQ